MSGEFLARARARLGTVLNGKYTLDRVLGVGGMAVVFQATHRNGRSVAVKMLHAELSLNSEIRGRFLKEGQAANAVRHPGVVAILDDDIAEDGTAFLVMEFLEGSSLEDLVDAHGGKLPLQPVVAAGIQLLDVLAAADAQGIVHRDVKPANVFVTRDGHLKVLDFGIARVKDLTSGITQSGTTMGTPGFMAPEQAAGRTSAIDALTDVWAVGATIYTLLAGRLVHEGESAQEIAVRSATLPVAPLSSMVQGVPEAISTVVDIALAFEKRDRWPSARAMRVALTAANREVFGGDVKRKVLSSLFASAKRAQASARVESAAPIDLGALDPAEEDSEWPPPPTEESETIVSPQIVDTSDRSETDLIVPAPAGAAPPKARTNLGEGDARVASRRHVVVAAAVFGAAAILAAIVMLRPDSDAASSDHVDSGAFEARVSARGSADSSVVDTGSVQSVSFDSLPPASAAPASSTPGDSVPSVSFDSLPRIPEPMTLRPTLNQPSTWPKSFPTVLDAGNQDAASKSTQADSSSGSLSIATTSGYCDVAVDGMHVGVTPLAELQVVPGRHHVVCSSPGQTPVEADVDVSVGGVTRYRFALTAQVPEANPYR